MLLREERIFQIRFADGNGCYMLNYSESWFSFARSSRQSGGMEGPRVDSWKGFENGLDSPF